MSYKTHFKVCRGKSPSPLVFRLALGDATLASDVFLMLTMVRFREKMWVISV